MADLGQAYVQIVPSAKGIKGHIEKELSGADIGAAGESAGNGLGGKLLSGLKTAFAAAAVGKVIKDAFEAGGALQQSFGGLDTLYGDAAAGAKEYAFQAAQAGISANDYAEQAVSFGAALKAAYGGDTTAAMEAANTAIMDMADNSAKMGTDLASIQNAYQGFAKGNYTMLDNLKLGYGGTKTEMERLLADAEKLTGIHYDISNLGDVYSAIHAVQQELGLTGVAAGEAQTTLTGSFGAMKAAWENTLAALTTGEGLEAALSNLTTSVGAFLNNVLSMLGELAPQIPEFMMGLAQVIIDNAPTLIASGVEMVLQLAVGLVQAIPELVDKIPEIWDALKSAWSSIDWSSLGIELINGIIRGLDYAATWLYNSLVNMAANALQSAKNWLGIGSPSKVFEQQVGRWIPAGVSVGIDDNMAPLNASIVGMADDMTGGFERATMSGATAAPTVSQAVGIDYAKLAQAISSRPVVIEGDTSRIFKVVQRENRTRTVATNYNILAAPARG